MNDAVGREELFAPAPPLRDDVRAAGASWGAALDGQAFFDQFGLDPAIHRFFLFRGPEGPPLRRHRAGDGVPARHSAVSDAEGVVRILTDHRAFPSAMRRQRSFAHHLNTVLAALRTRFPAIHRVKVKALR